MSKPLVSVIIPNYNYAKYLREAVDSALSQTYSEIEVIVVDDGSKDGSRQVIESYGTDIAALFQQNQGVSAARNNGVAASSGEFITFLDADDSWLLTKIEKQIAIFEADPKIGLVHVGVANVDDGGHMINEQTDGMSGLVAEDLLRFERPVILGGGSGIMVRRRVFTDVGGFDRRLSTSADWDLFYRICNRYRVGFVPEILLKYRLHGSNMHGNIKSMEHDMLLGYEKAFANGATVDRRKCYGKLHQVLAGSYFRAGSYRGFLKHASLSVWNRPLGIGYFLEFPLRKFRNYKYRRL